MLEIAKREAIWASAMRQYIYMSLGCGWWLYGRFIATWLSVCGLAARICVAGFVRINLDCRWTYSEKVALCLRFGVVQCFIALGALLWSGLRHHFYKMWQRLLFGAEVHWVTVVAVPWRAKLCLGLSISRGSGCPSKRSRFWQNCSNRPVLKHGPRSLTYVRVFGW